MSETTESFWPVWVCADCMIAKENDDWPDEEGDEEITTWPWSNYHRTVLPHAAPDRDRTTPGYLTNWVEHDDITGEISEGHHEFASLPCGGCGSALAGERFRYAEWSESWAEELAKVIRD